MSVYLSDIEGLKVASFSFSPLRVRRRLYETVLLILDLGAKQSAPAAYLPRLVVVVFPLPEPNKQKPKIPVY